MNFMNKLKNKTVFYYIALFGSLLALVTLIIDAVYVAKGGTNLALVYILIIVGIGAEIGLFFYDGAFSSILSMVAPISFTLAACLEIVTDYGNIVDMANGIKMYGNAALASFNFVITIMLIVSSILCLTACFAKREKTAK